MGLYCNGPRTFYNCSLILDPQTLHPGMTLLYNCLLVLEDVCQKQKFLPAEDYKLIHGRNTLDLTLSVRYANLANNAKLELVKAEMSRAESEVLIALQLESGDRLQAKFQPATSLWDLLLHWENQPVSVHKDVLTKTDFSQTPATHPVCIYLREEVIGETALKETKLRSLGLTGGKAVIRLAHRPVEEKTLQEIANKIEKERQVRAKRNAANTKQSGNASQSTSEASVQTPPIDSKSTDEMSSSGSQSATLITENTSISLNINVNIQGEPKLVKKDEEQEDEPKPKVGRVEKVETDPEPMEVEASDSAEAAMETEEVQKATADSTSTVADSSELRRQSQREAAENLRALNIPGVEIFTPDDFKELTPEEQQVAKKLAEAIMPRLGLQAAASNRTRNQVAVPKKKQQSNTQQFKEFKFPEETKGKKLYKNELSEMTKEDFKPCERETIVYSLEESILPESSSSGTDLPDDFFEVNEDDIKKLIVAQKKHLDALENQPLMTSAMRQARLESAYSKYDKVVIRFQFHDKLVLQGVFRPQETVFALQKFVKDYLEDKSTPFYLYTSPPKIVLKDISQTLLEARLVPASVVYFGCEKHQDHYLSEALLSEVRPRLQAEQIIAECLGISKYEEPGPIPKASSSKGKQPASQRNANNDALPSTSAQPSTSLQGQSKPVPKWFKIGKK